MTKPENSSILNVCILPPADVVDRCIAASQSLDPHDTAFRLGGSKFPHMTVYMARFSNNEIDTTTARLGSTLSLAGSFDCEHTGYFITAGGYLEASFAKTAAFLGFHQKIVEQMMDLRINPGNPYEESYFAPYSAQQRRNAETTGYDLAHELFRPHITLTRYKQGHVPRRLPVLPAAGLDSSECSG